MRLRYRHRAHCAACNTHGVMGAARLVGAACACKRAMLCVGDHLTGCDWSGGASVGLQQVPHRIPARCGHGDEPVRDFPSTVAGFPS
eukprot:9445320-Pyramimonas_sp.AAC.2